MKLDRTKPFGQVFGYGPAHAFEQDGRIFDHEGNEVVYTKTDAKADLARVAKAVRTSKVSTPETPEDPELSAQLKA